MVTADCSRLPMSAFSSVVVAPGWQAIRGGDAVERAADPVLFPCSATVDRKNRVNVHIVSTGSSPVTEEYRTRNDKAAKRDLQANHH